MRTITLNVELTEHEARALAEIVGKYEQSLSYFKKGVGDVPRDTFDIRAGTKLARAIRKAQESK